MNACYPITLVIDGRLCLVVGGGRIAERKIASLLHAGAQVRVVAREVAPAVAALATNEAVTLHERDFEMDDLEGAFVVIMATDDAALNARVSAECQARGLLVNVVDQTPLCNFYVPALIERGPISLAISTGGASPALAKHLRVLLEDAVGEEYGQLSTLMFELRGEMFHAHDQQRDRAAAWERLLGSDILEWLRRGDLDGARAHARELLGLPNS